MDIGSKLYLNSDPFDFTRVPVFVGVSQVLHSLVQDMAGFMVRLHQVKKT